MKGEVLYMSKQFWCKENVLLIIFLLVFLVSFFVIGKFPISELSYSDTPLIATRVAYYVFPILIVSMSVSTLLLAKKFWGLQTIKNRIIKWILGISLLVIGGWYVLLVNNFIGPLPLAEMIATNKFFSISVFLQCVDSSLLTYKGTLLLQLYSIGLYFSIT